MFFGGSCFTYNIYFDVNDFSLITCSCYKVLAEGTKVQSESLLAQLLGIELNI